MIKVNFDLFAAEFKVHEDERRAIYEVNCPKERFSLQGFIVKERLPLGKHAHSRKHEIFKVVEGGGFVLMVKPDPDGPKPFAPWKHRIVRAELTRGDVVHIAPFVAHTFYLDPGSRMTCFSSSAFDEKDKDFVPWPDLVEENVPV